MTDGVSITDDIGELTPEMWEILKRYQRGRKYPATAARLREMAREITRYIGTFEDDDGVMDMALREWASELREVADMLQPRAE